jgi:predicted SprT family Zn-dependent metalloprotease
MERTEIGLTPEGKLYLHTSGEIQMNPNLTSDKVEELFDTDQVIAFYDFKE